MPHWLIKSGLHRVISLLPDSQRWNTWFQERVTRSLDLGEPDFETKLALCEQYLQEFVASGHTPGEPFTVMEVGTGWFPIVPIGLYLCGASRVWTFDIAPLLRLDRVQHVVRLFCEYDRRGQLQTLLPQARVERLATLHDASAAGDTSTHALLERFNIDAVVRDACESGLPSGSVDLVFSCSVLQYVPAPVLARMLAESRRLMSPRGLMVHDIDLSDQFALFDRTITPLNFLRFTETQWRWLGSPLIPLTRLRLSEYRDHVTRAGFGIVTEQTASAPPEALARITVAAPFDRFSEADLRVVRAWVAARPA